MTPDQIAEAGDKDITIPNGTTAFATPSIANSPQRRYPNHYLRPGRHRIPPLAKKNF